MSRLTVEQIRAAFAKLEADNTEATADEWQEPHQDREDDEYKTGDVLTATRNIDAPELGVKITAGKEYLLVVNKNGGMPSYNMRLDLGNIVSITPEFLLDCFTPSKFEVGVDEYTPTYHELKAKKELFNAFDDAMAIVGK
jgi:hypothetical protein